MIVHNNLDQLSTTARCSCQFIHIHTEASVTCYIYNCFFRSAHLCANCSAKTVAHGSKAAGSKKSSWLFVFIILCRPHLVLSNLCGDDGITVRQLIKFLYNIRTCKLCVIIIQRIFCFQFLDMCDPLRMFFLRNFLKKAFQHFFHISDHACIHFDIFVDLRSIHIDLKDFCIVCKSLGISCYTVTETCSKNNEKITFRNTKIGSLGSVHTYHTGIKRILTWESTFTHQCIADRSLDPVSQFADFLVSTGDHTAAAYKNKRFLCLSDHFQRLVHIFFADVFDLTVNGSRMAWLVFIFHSCDILRNIHKNRARSSAFCNIKCSS